MKKIITMALLLMWMGSVSAQVTFWYGSRATLPLNIEDIDSITFRKSKYFAEQNLTLLQVWKDNELLMGEDKAYGSQFINDIAAQKLDKDQNYYSQSMFVDSIVWHPYAVESVGWYNVTGGYELTQDTLRLAMKNKYGQTGETSSYTHIIVEINPYWASINNYEVQNTDESVITVESEYNTPLWLWKNSGTSLALKLYTLKEGQTTITLTLNNTLHFELPVVVESEEMIPDKTDISLEDLYKRIYSRLVLTGDMLPDGKCDLPSIDEGTSSFYRAMHELQELPSDQLYWVWNDSGISEFRDNMVTSSNLIILGFFQRLYYNIWLCNSYLTRSEGDASLTTERAEVRFLRAYFYHYLLDMFGSVPIVTENTTFTTTPQSTRTELYDFVIDELLKAAQDLPEHKSSYYAVDRMATYLLLSRVYLNSEVYTGTAHNSEAALYASKVINSSYGLASKYKYLFMADNDSRGSVNDANQEIIFAIEQDGASTASWGGALYLMASLSFDNMINGTTESWSCLTSRKQLPLLFFSNVDTNPDSMQEANDDRAMFVTQNNETDYLAEINSKSYLHNGWKVAKWVNIPADNSVQTTDIRWPDTDIPLLRKAEAYLNYAEAVLRGGAEQNGLTALQAVNTLRMRANATALNTVSLEFILDERGREFYAEGYRRSDLIRFGKFGGQSSYLWNMQGGEVTGKSFPATQNLYPIPQSLLDAIPGGGVQNPGY